MTVLREHIEAAIEFGWEKFNESRRRLFAGEFPKVFSSRDPDEQMSVHAGALALVRTFEVRLRDARSGADVLDLTRTFLEECRHQEPPQLVLSTVFIVGTTVSLRDKSPECREAFEDADFSMGEPH